MELIQNRVQSRAILSTAMQLAFRAFYEAIPFLPQSPIHITTKQVRQHLPVVPLALVWMDIALMTLGGLLVGSSRGLLP